MSEEIIRVGKYNYRIDRNEMPRDWRWVTVKKYSQSTPRHFDGDAEHFRRICNAGNSSLGEYSAEDVAKELATPEEDRCSMPCGMLEYPKGGFWWSIGDSNGYFSKDFWDAVVEVLGYDTQSCCMWDSEEVLGLIEMGREDKGMVDEMERLGVLTYVPDEEEEGGQEGSRYEVAGT
jgi:hypothetical protein